MYDYHLKQAGHIFLNTPLMLYEICKKCQSAKYKNVTNDKKKGERECRLWHNVITFIYCVI